MSVCGECSRPLAVADTEMFKGWISTTGATSDRWNERLGGPTALVCPACDSYALGAELMFGMPFYSTEVAAFLTVHDQDWWNPSEIDIRAWPDFGCMTFSEAAIDSTVAYLREFCADRMSEAMSLAFEPALAGPAGIPEEGQPEQEWAKQLGGLHDRMVGAYSLRELDLAVRVLLRVMA